MDEIGEDYGDKELQPGGGEDSNELLNDIVWLRAGHKYGGNGAGVERGEDDAALLLVGVV